MTNENIKAAQLKAAAIAHQHALAAARGRANDLLPAAADTLARGAPPSGCDSILRWRDVSARTGLSRPTIWRAFRAGTFPRPVQLSSPAAVGWIASEVDALLSATDRP